MINTQAQRINYNDDDYYRSIGLDFNESISESETDMDNSPDYEGWKRQQIAEDYMRTHDSYEIHLYDGIKSVPIKMNGNRSADNKAYKDNGGKLPNVPYEIHHNPDMNFNSETCTMIALPKSVHDKNKPHWGAVCQYRKKYGEGY